MVKRSLLFGLCITIFFVQAHEQFQPSLSHDKQRIITLKNYYGTFDITEPVLCDLLECPSVKRLDAINQYGIDAYVNNFPRYTRYQHSVGVMCLLRRFGASLQEQIAGLLHDVSHTVFSHVGDHLFGNTRNACTLRDSKDSYQDSIHAWFMSQTEIAAILKGHGYAIDDVIHKNGMFTMLEQDIPDLCADRIEYNLYGGFIENRLTVDDIEGILSALRYHDGRWFFVDAKAARTLADAALFLTEHHFGTTWTALLNTWAAQALRRALDIEIVTTRELHFSTDDVIWDVLNSTEDREIKVLLHKLYHYKQYYKDVAAAEPYDYSIYPKFRGVNPWIQETDQVFIRLCECDQEYKREFMRIKEVLGQGRAVQLRGD
jgi:HD superfamily phosphohydrolase